jgi:hypothetical protein
LELLDAQAQEAMIVKRLTPVQQALGQAELITQVALQHQIAVAQLKNVKMTLDVLQDLLEAGVM